MFYDYLYAKTKPSTLMLADFEYRMSQSKIIIFVCFKDYDYITTITFQVIHFCVAIIYNYIPPD